MSLHRTGYVQIYLMQQQQQQKKLQWKQNVSAHLHTFNSDSLCQFEGLCYKHRRNNNVEIYRVFFQTYGPNFSSHL